MVKTPQIKGVQVDMGHMAHIDLAVLDTGEPPTGSPDHWAAHAADPNDPTVVQRRAEVLARAWRPPVSGRVAYLRSRARGRTVLDVGCVAHDLDRIASGNWLHATLAKVATSCVGVDVLSDGVEAMRDAGYDAVSHDLSTGSGPLAQRGPFQVIVAGELIEHVSDTDMLFRSARELLAADGELIITTPNPYAPARVRAGQRGDVWENVDHIVYAFPSGIAELASRHGLVLTAAMTTEQRRAERVGLVRRFKQAARRSRWHRRGFATTTGVVRSVVLDRRDILDRLRAALVDRLSSNYHFVGETFIYVIKRDSLR